MGKLTMKRKLALSASLMLLSLMNAVPTMADDNPTGFADMRDHWAKKAVATAIAKKYVDGYGDSSFRPENYVSTAEFIKMVVTATQLPVNDNTDGREWYVPYVKAAVEKGIVREDSINTNTINKPISRLEMSKVAVIATDPTLQQKYVSINDQGAMFTATSKGLIQGLANGELAQDGSTTRAQSVTIIERILSLNSGEKLETDKLAVSSAELAFKRTNLFSMIPVFGGKQSEDDKVKPWTPENLVMETPDGKYKGEIDQIIVVDLSNPNDSNRNLLGDISTWKWDTGNPRVPRPSVSDYPDSYIILIKGHMDFNKDSQLYADYQPTLGISGFGSPTPEERDSGKLVTLRTATTSADKTVYAFILPKQGAKTLDSINVTISAPAIPPQQNYVRNVVSIFVPSNK